VSLAFALPVAVLDLAGIETYLEVRHAQGDEEYVGFDGDAERPPPGEVIFADAAGHAHARRWTFRQSRRSTVTTATRAVLIVAEGMHPTAATDVPALIDAFAARITDCWEHPRQRDRLTARSPQIQR